MLGEIAQGKSNAAVAKSLFLSVRAVEKHINSLFSKLGLSEEHGRRTAGSRRCCCTCPTRPRGVSTTAGPLAGTLGARGRACDHGGTMSEAGPTRRR